MRARQHALRAARQALAPRAAPPLAPTSGGFGAGAGAGACRSLSTHGTADLDWSSLLFSYIPTNCHIEYTWKEGEWSEGELVAQPTTEIHILSSVLHYGQALFEGLKVFSRADGSVAMYQPYMGNVERMARGCARLGMPQVDEAIFNGAIERVVRENLEFVPPYGSGGALYIRPFMYGCGAQLGLGAAPEYKFTVAVNPVGDYYSGGLAALDGLVMTEYDRCAQAFTPIIPFSSIFPVLSWTSWPRSLDSWREDGENG